MDFDIEGDDGGGDEGAPAWMATFSDLATLLLTFFVLLLSFAELNVREFKEMLGSVKEAFGVSFETQGTFEALSNSPVTLSNMPPPPTRAQQEQEAVDEMQRHIEEEGLADDIEVEASDEGIIVRIREQLLFESGSANLNVEESAEVLNKVTELGNVFDREISIEGHTDDRPIANSQYPSNWELSIARATAVLRFMLGEANIDRRRMRIAGYADTHPIVPNDSEENRARNRRVEFIFHRSEQDDDKEENEQGEGEAPPSPGEPPPSPSEQAPSPSEQAPSPSEQAPTEPPQPETSQ